MPSSISSSEPADSTAFVAAPPQSGDGGGRAIVLSLVSIGLLLAILELGMRLTYDRLSHTAKRIAEEYTLARSIAPATPPAILFVGNSLLLEGVDFPDLQRRTVSQARVSRFIIENTGWLDWYYGVRRLLAEGSRPKAIILCLNALQLMGSTIRGDYSSLYLFQASDIPAVAREAHYDLTRTSSLFFAHYSRFYADRTNLRSFLLNRLDPAYVDMMFQMTVRPTILPSSGEVEQKAETRLAALKASCDQSGVRCILLIPPGFTPGEKEVGKAATRVGADVWVPIPQNALPNTEYKDNYHLNSHGAAIFTQALAIEVKKLAVKKLAVKKLAAGP